MGLITIFDAIADTLSRLEHPGRDCDLNLAIGNTGVFTCNDRSLVSVIELRGCRHFIGMVEHEENVKELNALLNPYFMSKQIDIGFFYESSNDVDLVARELENISMPSRSASAALGLKNQSLIEESNAVLEHVSHVERCWLVCWTNKNVSSHIPDREKLPPSFERQMTAPDKQSLNGVHHFAARSSVHEAMVNRVLDIFKQQKFSVRRLTGAEMARNIRCSIDARKTDDGWEPLLAGNNRSKFFYPADPGREVTEGPSVFLPPKIGHQVWPVEPERDNLPKDVLKIGNKIYKVLVLRIMPNGPVPFSKLLKDAGKQGLPLRFAGLLRSEGRSRVAGKYALASLLTILPIPSMTKTVRDQISNVQAYVDENREAETAIQICFTTWADADQLQQLNIRADKLVQVVNGWNKADAFFLQEDVLEGFTSTLPAYRRGSVAPAAIGPLADVLYSMPITRPTMPFDTGSMCFRTDDGRLIPFQPFDYNVMRHHIYLLLGEPGFGKSATLNNMLTCLTSSSNDIPNIGISDVGTSSLGFIQLAQSILPEGKKHYAIYHRMRNRKEDSYNFLEADYGLRAPLAEHFDEIANMLELMFSDDRTGELNSDMPGLIRAVLKLAYRMRAETGSKSDPEYYRKNRRNDKHWPAIATVLEKLDITPTEDDTWWNLFDQLHNGGYYREAGLVQRFAAPTLPFLAAVASRDEIRQEYPGTVKSGMPLVDYFARTVGELVEKYPMLSYCTELDLGEARIISLDLEEVVPRASKQDFALKKQGAIFFLVAARILTSRFFWKEDRLTDIPKQYHSYHRPRIKTIRQTPNVFACDELQRFGGIDQVKALLEKVTNEGRKWEIGLILSSQDIVEMPERVIKFSTARFICGFEDKSVNDVATKLKLTDTEKTLIIDRIRPPGRDGAWLLVQLDADEQKYSLLLNLRMGPEKLWGLSTKNKDALVRSSVYDAFGDVLGRRLLAKMYPSGSIGDEYDTRIQRLSKTEDMGLMDNRDITENKDVIQAITDNILKSGRSIYENELRGAA